MEYIIKGRTPEKLYRFFEEISAIPRGSRNEKAISQYLVDFAAERGLWVYRDSWWNVIIKKEGTGCGAGKPPLLLECHTDMVCAKEEGSSHDFLKDGIRLIQEGSILRADGTTLGADNGCGVAILLYILDSSELVHPPLECFFAAQEETGCVGAENVDVSQFQAKRAIGLDAGTDGVFCMGTTTKHDIKVDFPVSWIQPPEAPLYSLTVSGLRGGYPALCMPMERTSAVWLMGRALHFLRQVSPVALATLEGSDKGLVQCCTASFSASLPSHKLEALAAELQHRWRVEFAASDPDITLALKPAASASVIGQEASDRLIHLLMLCPQGVYSRNPEMPALVNSFVNCRRLSLAPGMGAARMNFLFSAESPEKMEELKESLQLVLRLFGGHVCAECVDPGWPVRQVSPVRETMIRAFQELFGRRPYVKISHGGNDCVKLVHRMPELDVVTCAADYLNFHTPKEYLDMDSFERTWKLVVRTIGKLAEEEEEHGANRSEQLEGAV